MNRKRGKGERNIQCEHYDECLNIAAQKGWSSFNCESCPLFKAEPKEAAATHEKQENTRICKLCDKNFTIQPSSPYCASCLALKAKESRAKKKEAIEHTPRARNGNQEGGAALKTEKGPIRTIGKGEIVDPGRNMELVFRGKHGYLLKEIQRLAEEEVRTIDEQIIYILKNYLSNNHVTTK